MFCSNCGERNSSTALFCMKCGNALQPNQEIGLNQTSNCEGEMSNNFEMDSKVSNLRQKLVQFYSKHNSEKLKDSDFITKTVNRYVDREEELQQKLDKLYPSGQNDFDEGISNRPFSSIQRNSLSNRAFSNDNFDSNSVATANCSLNNGSAKNPYYVNAQIVIDGLKELYREKILPLEEAYKFSHFASPSLTNTDFDAKPLVLCIGQYSTGKTTFIKYLLERDFPGLRIGPEPTTDRFVAVMYGNNERIIPGNAVAVQNDKPFTALQKYGMAFLNKFECAELPAPILESLNFVDTPGVLAGNEQTKGRTYKFAEVIEQFAERADRILLLFDAHKLDISDELKAALMALKGHDDKIRCVLNKADMVDNQALMRVYGALMQSLGKVIRTPEVLRVYIGSFWDRPYKNTDNAALFDAERNDLLADLRSLPRHSAIRKVNELVKRARMSKVHALILTHLRDQFGFFGKAKKQKQLLENLSDEFRKVQLRNNLPFGDFPSIKRFTETLSRFEINKFPKLNPKMIDAMNQVLSFDIPELLKKIPNYKELVTGTGQNPFNNIDDNAGIENPHCNDMDQRSQVISGSLKSKYDNYFYQCTQENKLSGEQARPVLLKSGIPVDKLRKIWDLADSDGDGFVDAEEFAVCMYLIDQYRNGVDLPDTLPLDLIPPSRRAKGIF